MQKLARMEAKDKKKRAKRKQRDNLNIQDQN
jgi:hypothetical protein